MKYMALKYCILLTREIVVLTTLQCTLVFRSGALF